MECLLADSHSEMGHKEEPFPLRRLAKSLTRKHRLAVACGGALLLVVVGIIIVVPQQSSQQTVPRRSLEEHFYNSKGVRVPEVARDARYNAAYFCA